MQATVKRLPRQAQPLAPVSVRAAFVGGATAEDLLLGAAVLEIEGVQCGQEEMISYWTQAVVEGGAVAGYTLKRFNSADVYHLPADLSGCTCGDSVYRPGRPGGCRHAAALRQALAANE